MSVSRVLPLRLASYVPESSEIWSDRKNSTFERLVAKRKMFLKFKNLFRWRNRNFLLQLCVSKNWTRKWTWQNMWYVKRSINKKVPTPKTEVEKEAVTASAGFFSD